MFSYNYGGWKSSARQNKTTGAILVIERLSNNIAEDGAKYAIKSCDNRKSSEYKKIFWKTFEEKLFCRRQSQF